MIYSDPIWVDEYLHGYQDAPTLGRNALQKSVWADLLRTPLSLVALQVIVLLLVALWGQRRWFSPPVTLGEPVMDNSKAYIQAMFSVLHRATCSEFVLETVGWHRVTVQEWLRLYRQGGLTGLLSHKPRLGRQHSIPQSAQDALNKRLQQEKGFNSYGEICQWLESQLGIVFPYKTVHQLMHYRLKASPKAARPISVAQHFADSSLIIQLDQAGCHRAKRLQIPSNIIWMFQPSYAPETNPIEQVWLHLKRGLRWKLPQTLDELRLLMRERLQEMTQAVIGSIVGRASILEALSVAGL